MVNLRFFYAIHNLYSVDACLFFKNFFYLNAMQQRLCDYAQ